MSQKQLSDVLRCDHTTITKVINGTRGVSADTLYSLAEALDCSVDYLMGRTDDRRVHQLAIDDDGMQP
jgi:transcriptional regulator with XRE-family HTH domain